MNHLFCFGLGYSASIIVDQLLEQNWRISATSTNEDKIEKMKEKGIVGHLFTDDIALLFPQDILQDVTHILISIPPNDQGDIVFQNHINDIKQYAKNLKWIGLFSTTGVYGDHQGEWVDENTPVNPKNQRSINRCIAENQWLNSELPVSIFRLSGIYGKRSNAIKSLQEGTAKIVNKENQFFSRIHVEDIANIILKSIEKNTKNQIFNCSDNLPCSTLEIMTFASHLCNIGIPNVIDIEDKHLSEMAKEFYKESKKVSNKKIINQLNVVLKYPTYKEGLQMIINGLSL